MVVVYRTQGLTITSVLPGRPGGPHSEEHRLPPVEGGPRKGGLKAASPMLAGQETAPVKPSLQRSNKKANQDETSHYCNLERQDYDGQ